MEKSEKNMTREKEQKEINELAKNYYFAAQNNDKYGKCRYSNVLLSFIICWRQS